MDLIQLSHGGGGQAAEGLIRDVFLKGYDYDLDKDLEDAAICKVGHQRIAFTTDGYTVKPIFFPGGDIGRLAVSGTVNDLLMRGARPKLLSSSFIIEEGFPLGELERIVKSMKLACTEAQVKIVTGDTKVVPKGGVDGLFINTSGVGLVSCSTTNISISNARPGDLVLLSGTMGDHGLAILASRENFSFDPPLESDCAPLVEIVKVLGDFPHHVRVLRDPTRGGVAEVLHNIAQASKVGVEVFERVLPIKASVKLGCEMLGLDPLSLANEGILVAVLDSSRAQEILGAIKGCNYGENATLIGTINDTGLVTVKTAWGTSRILPRPSGELIPRIC